MLRLEDSCEDNPHYTKLYDLLRQEAEEIIQGYEDREKVIKHAEDVSMSEEEYREFLEDFYFASQEDRNALLISYMQSISLRLAIKQRFHTQELALMLIEKVSR